MFKTIKLTYKHKLFTLMEHYLLFTLPLKWIGLIHYICWKYNLFHIKSIDGKYNIILSWYLEIILASQIKCETNL